MSQPVSQVPHTTYTVNNALRVTKVVDPAGNERSTSYTPFHDVQTYTNAAGGTTTNTYGANGGESLTETSSPTGASTSLAYTNSELPYQPSTSTDAQGNTSAYTYSGAGNLASAENALAAEASLTYNGDGTVATATAPANDGNPTTYNYNGRHQLTKMVPPSGNSLGATSYTYDRWGRVKTVTDGRGVTTTYTYDDNDRVTKVAYDSYQPPTVSYTYDDVGNLVERAGDAGTTTYTSDALNRMTSKTGPLQGESSSYGYDPAGNLTALTDGRGTSEYHYNDRNLLVRMVDGAGDIFRFAYDADGRRTDTWFASNADHTVWAAHTELDYDDSGRLVRTTSTRDSSSPAVVADLSYCYADHAAGEPCPTADSADTSLRQSRTNHKTGVTSVFDHDQGNRLVEALNVHGQDYAYTYDANSNRTTVTVDGQQTQQRSFNSANQITNSGYTYDGAGNLTSTPRLPEITYNGADQMSTVSTADGGPYHFGYAGTNQVERIRSGGRNFTTGPLGIQSVRRPSMTYYVERDASGAMLAYQSTQGGAAEGHTDYYYVRDGLGSVIAMVQQNGDLAASYDYSPYGKTLSATGKSINGANRFRYAGGYQDKWSELTKFGHRYYNQNNGRWTQRDPLNQQLDPINANRYAYAACNPSSYVVLVDSLIALWSELLRLV